MTVSDDESNGRDGAASDDGSSREGPKDPEKRPWHQMSREEVMERLDNYKAKQRANRRRLTGDDVQEMLRERRAQRQQRKRERKEQRSGRQKSQRDVGRSVRLSLGGALLVGALGTGALAATSTDSTEERVQSNDETIALLQGEIRALEADTWDEQDADELEEQLDEAVERSLEKGEQVAQAQNTYQEIFAGLNDEELPGDGDSSDAYAEIGEHREELVDLFDESARIIQDEDAYFPGADVPYGAGEIDVLAPWYTRFTDESDSTYAEASLNSWELVSATPSAGSPGTVSVAWLNRDSSSGDLLAWARATYDDDTEKFHSLYVGQTTAGELPADDADQEGAED